MTKCKVNTAGEYIYTDFEVDEDIIINYPRGSFSKDMSLTAFAAIIHEVKSRELKEWYIIENYHRDIKAPDSLESLSEYYKLIKTLGCKRVILIADLPTLKRLTIIHALSKSEIEFNFMPNLDSALSWISYLRICGDKKHPYFSYNSY